VKAPFGGPFLVLQPNDLRIQEPYVSQYIDAPKYQPPPVQGVRDLEPHEAVGQRRLVLFLTILPFAGVLAAAWLLWGTGLSAVDAALFGAFYLFTGLGVTVGYHRLFTHRSFKARRALKVVLALAGSMAVEGSLISWCATHRRHHAYSDKDGDPHSPHLDEGPGFLGVVKGLWHAHMGWLVTPQVTEESRWGPDLLKDPDLRWITKMFPWIAVTSFFLPAILGFVITRSLWGAVTAFVWASLVRIFMLHHVTWSINSICHFYGDRPFKSLDFSTNNWVLSIISFGESWHNNHHAFPTSARHGLGRAQVDVSAWIIAMFKGLRWAADVKMVSAKQMASKQVASFKPRGSLVAASRQKAEELVEDLVPRRVDTPR
jgi:stearoyl-CoA desaturase (delta-9 desaturase)